MIGNEALAGLQTWATRFDYKWNFEKVTIKFGCNKSEVWEGGSCPFRVVTLRWFFPSQISRVMYSCTTLRGKELPTTTKRIRNAAIFMSVVWSQHSVQCKWFSFSVQLWKSVCTKRNGWMRQASRITPVDKKKIMHKLSDITINVCNRPMQADPFSNDLQYYQYPTKGVFLEMAMLQDIQIACCLH